MNRVCATAKTGFKKVTHVIFDLDGLLLDSETLYTQATQNIVEPYGKVYTAGVKRQIMGLTGVEVAVKIVDLLDLPITPEEYIAKALEQYSAVMPAANLMPGKLINTCSLFLVVDTERIYKSVISDIAQQYGKVYTNDVLKKLLGTTQWDTCKIAVHELKLPITVEQFNDYFNSETKLRLSRVGYMPGAEKFVKHLHKHNVPIAVATSSSKPSYELKIQKHEALFSLFHHKVTGGSDPDVTRGKPSPDIFLICASRFPEKPQPSDCLVFEDAPNGVQAAVSAGMQCVMVPDPEIITPEFQKQASLVLNSLEEFQPEAFGLPPY